MRSVATEQEGRRAAQVGPCASGLTSGLDGASKVGSRDGQNAKHLSILQRKNKIARDQLSHVKYLFFLNK
jgi:hypothetical protein